MTSNTKVNTAPYSSFSSFMRFINKLQETNIPSRIDPSVFGNASGSISYSIIATLKSLKLINNDGVPNPTLNNFVKASDADRKEMMKGILRAGYPSLWAGTFDLTAVTAGQFDEHLRSAYDVKGSTVDKAAAFFIAAANYANEPISPHLKARKAVASSSSSKKSPKQRRKEIDFEDGDDGLDDDDQPPPISKPLEYQLIDLMGEPDIEEGIKASIWNLVQFLMKRKTQKELP
jgi:hypothetical protein